jgi:tRNA(adenine34) deaminase
MTIHLTAGKPDEYWMKKAIRLAKLAEKLGEIPVGAVLVNDNGLVSVGCNLSIQHHDPSAHAEMVALRRAGQRVQNYRLVDTTLFVTLEPCTMCAGLLVHARINRLVFGAFDPKAGAAGSVFDICRSDKLNHQMHVDGGVMAETCSAQLSEFFKQRRNAKKEEKKRLAGLSPGF